MKLKKNFSFKDKNQIWRLLISNSDKIIIETRDTDNKEAFFHSFDLTRGKKIFKNLQLDEKFWIGIETIHEDIIFFHLFAKPNMPEHKKIIAYHILDKRIIWINEEFTFLTLYENILYAFKKKFEGQDVYALNYKTGEIIDELGSDIGKLNEVLNSARTAEDFSNYKYPQKIDLSNNSLIGELINNETYDKDISENSEFILFHDLLFFNYYTKSQHNLLDNQFVVYNIEKKKKVFSETINSGLNSSSPDSFFCYKNYLLLLKNKIEIISYKIT